MAIQRIDFANLQLHDTFGIRFEMLICTLHRWVDLSSMSQVKAHLGLGKEFKHVLQFRDRPSSALPPVHGSIASLGASAVQRDAL